ncbi:serine/threonine-protein kinase [Leucobacter japonicus]|uniref:serine/threonine-protein kinase n=1 Tax=Leucobacter japonicus TaxID=1461259 RepID=UPI0009498AE3|nr:serine/threonine-protein kinase [Leucobacter japonicus]
MSSIPERVYIADRYEVLAALGAGAYGEVYRVRDSFMNVEAALKLIGEEPFGIWREAQILQKASGEHLLPVLNADLASGRPYIVTALATHGTLADRIVPGLGVPISDGVKWGRQSAQGVARLHDLGLLHCDIKPENIFLDDRQNALVGDLGLAQLVDNEGFVLAAGSVHTMAPEVAAAMAKVREPRSYSAASDVFSLAATVYWLLAGKPAVPKDSYSRLMSFTAEDVWIHAPHLPRGLRDVINRATAFDPKDRYASPAEFDAALGSYRVPQRIWTRISAHESHLDCFVGQRRSSPDISVCSERSIRTNTICVEVHYTGSGRRIKEHSVECKRRDFGQRLRAIFRAL